MRHDGILGHEPIRIITAVTAARQPHSPVGDDQAETVPAIAPRLAHPAALEDNVFDPRMRELVADREPRLTGADDHDVHVFYDAAPSQEIKTK